MGTVTGFNETWHNRGVNSTTKAKDSTTTVIYILKGTSDLTHLEAETYAKTNGPAADSNLLRKSIQLDEICPGYFRCKFQFAHPDSDESNDDQQPTDPTEFSFDTSGGTTHLTTSLGTTSYPSSGNTPDFKNAIGVTDSDNVEGVDIIIPQFLYTEKKVFTTAQMTLTFAKTISDLTGTTNDSTFKGWATGEVLFAGASGSKRNGGDWDVTFSFIMEKNVTGLDIGDITGIDKKGHQYLWVLFEPQEDTTAKRLVRRPIAVYVEDVYESGDLSALGIGTT